MSTVPSTETGPRAAARQAPSVAAYVGIAAGLLALTVLICAAGVVDERIAPLWNPSLVFATAAGLVYTEPRAPLWQVTLAGALLGLAYAALVLGADMLSAPRIHLAPAPIVLRAVVMGVAPAFVGGFLLRRFAPASRAGRR